MRNSNINHNDWSSPTTNYFKALKCLVSALNSGYDAVLIKTRNENCQYPIKSKNVDTDFRNYDNSGTYMRSRKEILDDKSLTEFEKHLALNYKQCFGSPDAAKRYYETGELSEDNFRGVGLAHLVNVTDMIEFYEKSGKDVDTINSLKDIYKNHTQNNLNKKHWYGNFKYKHGSQYSIKKMKRKVWVVRISNKTDNQTIPIQAKIFKFITKPLKYIPRKDILVMNEYKCITYRIGSIVNGISVEFHIPKKFSFKEA